MLIEQTIITILYLLGSFMTWVWIREMDSGGKNWQDLLATIFWPITAIIGIIFRTWEWLSASN